jgi:hypothetical protein
MLLLTFAPTCCGVAIAVLPVAAERPVTIALLDQPPQPLDMFLGPTVAAVGYGALREAERLADHLRTISRNIEVH